MTHDSAQPRRRTAKAPAVEPESIGLPCSACDGRGVIWASFKFYKTCSACQGSKRAADV